MTKNKNKNKNNNKKSNNNNKKSNKKSNSNKMPKKKKKGAIQAVTVHTEQELASAVFRFAATNAIEADKKNDSSDALSWRVVQQIDQREE